MKLLLKRNYYEGTYTIGALQIQTDSANDYVKQKYFCDTLEPKWRDLRKEAKVMGATAIPAGRYRIVFAFSRKYQKLMPYVDNVPHFSGVMIHPGNTVDDTRGCILVGVEERPQEETFGDKATTIGRLVQSRVTFSRLYELMLAARKNGEDIMLEVIPK